MSNESSTNSHSKNRIDDETMANKSTYAEIKEEVVHSYHDMKGKAEDIYHHVKDSAREAYEDSKTKVSDAQQFLEEHSEDLIKTIKNNPLTSLLIAAGIGFAIAAALAKKDNKDS